MSASEKKISFSFSKVKKPPISSNVSRDAKEKVEFVDSFDGTKGTFSYKGNVRKEKSPQRELVIPMVASDPSRDIRARIEEKIKSKSTNTPDSHSNSQRSLDEIAAAEILNDLKDNSHNHLGSNKLIISSETGPEADDSIIDYDQVPVGDFGLAMLRGMGWKPDMGIGKDPKLVSTVSPKLRPKGLGLGAKPEVEEGTTKKEKLPTAKIDSKS